MSTKENDQKLIQQLTDAMATSLQSDRLNDFEDAQEKRAEAIEIYFEHYSDDLSHQDRDFFDKIFESDRQFEATLKQKKQEYFESVKVQKKLKDGLSAYKLSSPGKQR